MIQTRAGVLANEQLNEEHWRLTLSAPGIAATVAPGQFVNIRVGATNAPLCRRPFSVFRVVHDGGRPSAIEVVYRVVGQGTGLMSGARAGDYFDVIGPLGTGYRPDHSKRVHILAGGGCGAAGLFTLGQQLAAAANEKELEILTLLGFRSRSAVMLEREFASLGGDLIVATDDGTHGCQGQVVDLLVDLIENQGWNTECIVYGSGPDEMGQALVRFCRQTNISGQVAVEKHLLCGIGCCLTCICEVDRASVQKHRGLGSSHIQIDPEADLAYALVCTDGPVFDVDELVPR